MRRRLVTVIVALSILLALPAYADAQVRTYEGEIDGARYLVRVPQNWNGTLVLWSHGASSRPGSR